MVFFIVFGFFLVFFRDPEREAADGIVAAADGVIQGIEEKSGVLIITTFMNLHNVHVNRAPLSGKIKSVERIKGRYRPAFKDVSKVNSRVVIVLDTEIGEVRLTQIAGIFAWRIVPYVSSGTVVKKGERIGIIRFGSKVVVELPAKKVKCAVVRGQKVLAASTKIGGIQ
jgi:phosphatidylserine decarboxylase